MFPHIIHMPDTTVRHQCRFMTNFALTDVAVDVTHMLIGYNPYSAGLHLRGLRA